MTLGDLHRHDTENHPARRDVRGWGYNSSDEFNDKLILGSDEFVCHCNDALEHYAKMQW